MRFQLLLSLEHCLQIALLLFLGISSLGCDATGEVAFSLIEAIEDRNAAAKQAMVDLQPRPEAAWTEIEKGALRIANHSLKGNNPRVKEAFCGSPPDLSHLPTEYFKPSIYISEDTSIECRAAADRRFPNLESCYLVLGDGSTAHINCYSKTGLASDVECVSAKRLLWEILWDPALRKSCAESEE